MRAPRQRFLVSLLAVLLSGCAIVRVMSVTHPAQPEGIPYYLPRPYVQVFEPFVISSTNYFVSRVLSSDKQFLLIDNVKDQNELSTLFKNDLSKDALSRVPVSAVGNPSDAYPASGTPQGDSETAAAETEKKEKKDEPAKPRTEAPAATGNGKYGLTVTNTTAIFTPTLGRRFFDIVWMPDFEEKYVVQSTAGLGRAEIGITMTQGWGLYGLNARIDNSGPAKPLLDFYSSVFGSHGKLASSKITPPIAATGALQGSMDTGSMSAGERVSIKVMKVIVAAPGLYPVLKPNEVSALDARDKANPHKRHLPLRPFTNVAFNTYEVIVVEAAKPSGDTPMNLQRYVDPATGVTPSPPARAGAYGTTVTGLNANDRFSAK